MTGVWTEAEDGGENRPAGQVHPYEDWEFQALSRPLHRVECVEVPVSLPGGASATVPVRIDMLRWHPVYVELRAGQGGCYAGAARRLIEAAEVGANLRLGPDALRNLRTIAACETERDIGHLTRFFIYRPTCAAYKSIGGLFRVILVGPSVSHAQVRSAVPEADQPGACDMAPACLDGPVAIAVIDDAIGVANARLRGRSGETRVAWYWKQGAESAAPGAAGDAAAAVPAGQAFSGAEIDTLLAQAGGHERAFYAALEREIGRRAERPAFRRRELGPVLASDIALESGHAPVTRSGLQGLLDGIDGAALLHRRPKHHGPHRRAPEFRAAHGTHVADLAAGFPMEQAPSDRPVIAIELPELATAQTDGARVEVFALQAVIRALDWADTWMVEGEVRRIPLVLNISYGRSAGPKNGLGFLEREVARLVEARNREVPTKVVLAAGNAYRARLAAGMSLAPGQCAALDWIVQPDDRSASFLEVRLPADADVAFHLNCPTGERLDLRLAQREVPAIRDWQVAGVTIGRAYLQRPEEEGGALRLTLALAPTKTWDRPGRTVPCGAYRIALSNTGTAPVDQIHFDVQRDDTLHGYPARGRQSYLEHRSGRVQDPETGNHELPAPESPLTRSRTLSAFATALSAHVFVVGGAYAADHRPAGAQPARYSPAGPVGARPGPDLAAVTEDGRATPGRRAAGFLSGATVAFSGTSAAAPQIARRLAELLGQGQVEIGAAEVLGTSSQDPDPRTGHGVLPQAPDSGRAPRRRG